MPYNGGDNVFVRLDPGKDGSTQPYGHVGSLLRRHAFSVLRAMLHDEMPEADAVSVCRAGPACRRRAADIHIQRAPQPHAWPVLVSAAWVLSSDLLVQPRQGDTLDRCGYPACVPGFTHTSWGARRWGQPQVPGRNLGQLCADVCCWPLPLCLPSSAMSLPSCVLTPLGCSQHRSEQRTSGRGKRGGAAVPTRLQHGMPGSSGSEGEPIRHTVRSYRRLNCISCTFLSRILNVLRASGCLPFPEMRQERVLVLQGWLFDEGADSYPDISANSIPPNPTCCGNNTAGAAFTSNGQGASCLLLHCGPTPGVHPDLVQSSFACLPAYLPAALVTVNGGHAPVIHMRSGEWQRWQLVYAGEWTGSRCCSASVQLLAPPPAVQLLLHDP